MNNTNTLRSERYKDDKRKITLFVHGQTFHLFVHADVLYPGMWYMNIYFFQAQHALIKHCMYDCYIMDILPKRYTLHI